MILTVLLGIGCFAALVALVMVIVNLAQYHPAPEITGSAATNAASASAADEPLVSVCIPARNEEANIEQCVRSLLAGTSKRIEVLVYNDQSTDRTGEILARLAAEDPRVKAVPTLALQDGWNGKQFGCQQAGNFASGSWLLFTDADVRFAPDAIARTLAAAAASKADLVSTFPRQDTVTIGEKLVIPLIHFILLSYLPIPRMRTTNDPAACAGCGQFLFVRSAAWRAAGGHAAFKDSMHDGIKLPRAVRKAGLKTDLFDGTDLCRVRMYNGFGATWRGFAKNAFEGLGSVTLLVVITVMHLLGHVLPWLVVVLALLGAAASPLLDAAGLGGLAAAFTQTQLALAISAVVAATLERAMLAARFQQSLLSVVLHPVGITLMTLIQWHSLILAKTGRRSWRGRTQVAAAV